MQEEARETEVVEMMPMCVAGATWGHIIGSSELQLRWELDMDM